MSNPLELDCKHITIRVSDTIKAKAFYIDQLGLTLLDDKPKFFAAQAGQVRISFFGRYLAPETLTDQYAGTQIIFSTGDIEAAKNQLVAHGLILTTDISNANNYLKFIALKDRDGILVSIAQYLVPDTLEKKV